MLIREIAEKIRSGEFTIDNYGHSVTTNAKYFLEWHDKNVSMAAGKGDGTWGEREGQTQEDTDANMRRFYLRRIETDLEIGDDLIGFFDSYDCNSCGKRMYYIFTGNKLELRMAWDATVIDSIGRKGDHILLHDRCSWETPLFKVRTINVQSQLIFTNFFRGIEDVPDDNEFGAWSLNTDSGRDNRMTYKAEVQNIAYGQMSNMSIGIYVRNDKKSIIIGLAFHPAENDDSITQEQYEILVEKPIFENYELVGTICLEVWRFEATDEKTLGKKRMKQLAKEKYMDVIKLDVEHGVWEWQHWFDTCDNGYNYIPEGITPPMPLPEAYVYSRFTLRENA
jgi:hypothetical protein